MSSIYSELKLDLFHEIIDKVSAIIPKNQSQLSEDEKQGRRDFAMKLIKELDHLQYEIDAKYSPAISKRLKYFESKRLVPFVKRYKLPFKDEAAVTSKIAIDYEFWSCKIYYQCNSDWTFQIKRFEFEKDERLIEYQNCDDACFAVGKFFCFDCWLKWDGYMIEKDHSKYGSSTGLKICKHKYPDHKEFIDKKELAFDKLAKSTKKLADLFAEADVKTSEILGLQKLLTDQIPQSNCYIGDYLESLDAYDKFVDTMKDNLAFMKELVQDGTWKMIPDHHVCSKYGRLPLDYPPEKYAELHEIDCQLDWSRHDRYDYSGILCSKAWLLIHASDRINYSTDNTAIKYKKSLSTKTSTEIYALLLNHTSYANTITEFGHRLAYLFVYAEMIKRQQLNLKGIEQTPLFKYFYDYLSDEVKIEPHQSFYHDLSTLTKESMPRYIDELAETDDVETFKLLGPKLVRNYTSSVFVSKLIGSKKVKVAVEAEGKVEIRETEKSESLILKYLYTNGWLFTCPDHMLVKLIQFDVNLYKSRKDRLYYLTSTYNDLNIIWEDTTLTFEQKFNIICSWKHFGHNGLTHGDVKDSPDMLDSDLNFLQTVLPVSSLRDIAIDYLVAPDSMYVNKRHQYLREWLKTGAIRNTCIRSVFDAPQTRKLDMTNLYTKHLIDDLDSKSNRDSLLETYEIKKELLDEYEKATEFDDEKSMIERCDQHHQFFMSLGLKLPHLHCREELKRTDDIKVKIETYFQSKRKTELMAYLNQLDDQLTKLEESKLEESKTDFYYLHILGTDPAVVINKFRSIPPDLYNSSAFVSGTIAILLGFDSMKMIDQLQNQLIVDDLYDDISTEICEKMRKQVRAFWRTTDAVLCIESFLQFKKKIDGITGDLASARELQELPML